MEPVHLSSRSGVGMHLDVFAHDLHETVVAEYRSGLQAPIERAVADIEAVKQSPDYTHQGKINAVEARKAKALEALQPFVQRVTGYDTRIADTIARATATPRKKELHELLLEREIRDLLRGKDPLEVQTMVLEAIERGDQAFVDAVESAPGAFPLLTPAGRQLVTKMRIEKSPAAGELQQLQREREIIAAIVEAAEQDIRQAADFGVPGPAAQGSGSADAVEDLAR